MKILLFTHVNWDGNGDFQHCLDIYLALMGYDAFKQAEFIPIITCFDNDAIERCKEKLSKLQVAKYHIGLQGNIPHFLYTNTNLKQDLREADLILEISFKTQEIEQFFAYARPQTPRIFIGEHERTGPHTWSSMKNPMIVRSMGLTKDTYGLKLRAPHQKIHHWHYYNLKTHNSNQS